MNNPVLRLIIVILLLTAGVAAAHIVPGYSGTYVDANFRDALHILGFAMVAAVIFELSGTGVATKSLTAFGAVVAMGVVGEASQLYVGLDFNENDILRDAAGAGAYIGARLIWLWSMQPGRAGVSRQLSRVAAVIIVGLIAAPTVYWVSVFYSYRERLPVVLDFAVEMDSQLVSPINSRISVDRDSGVAVFALQRRNWSGAVIETVASDWSSYRYIVLRVAMADAPETRVAVELSDGSHSEYRSQHLIGAQAAGTGFTDVRFPLQGIRDVAGRPELDLSHVKDIYVLGKHKGASATMLLDKIWLE